MNEASGQLVSTRKRAEEEELNFQIGHEMEVSVEDGKQLPSRVSITSNPNPTPLVHHFQQAINTNPVAQPSTPNHLAIISRKYTHNASSKEKKGCARFRDRARKPSSPALPTASNCRR
jgi:hypothetical protein